MPLATALPSLLPPAAPNDLATLLPLSLFAFVTSITPGPNNLMLTASSIRFGFQRTIFHMLGILFGLSVMLALFGSGVGGLILAVPAAHSMLKFASACYLVYLAWQMRKMGFADADRACDGARPLSFANAALFQLANPKAWMMALTAAASFMPALHPAWLSICVLCMVFFCIGAPCIAVWAGAGAILGKHLQQTHWRRLFCALMIGLTLYTALAIYL
jgi:threonine/homoserine/homoserine lactone efflux protein